MLRQQSSSHNTQVPDESWHQPTRTGWRARECFPNHTCCKSDCKVCFGMGESFPTGAVGRDAEQGGDFCPLLPHQHNLFLPQLPICGASRRTGHCSGVTQGPSGPGCASGAGLGLSARHACAQQTPLCTLASLGSSSVSTRLRGSSHHHPSTPPTLCKPHLSLHSPKQAPREVLS